MGQDNTHDVSTPPDGLPRPRPRWRFAVLAGLTGAALALLLGLVFRDWLPASWLSGGAPEDHFPPGALADYIPEDSEAVLVVQARPLLDSPLGRRHLAPSLKPLVRQGERRFHWMGLLGINPLDDLDSLQMSFAPGSGGQPLWLARGRFDRSRFGVGPDKLQAKIVDRFRVWEYVDRSTKRTTRLAAAGDALIVSDTPARVMAALERASHPRPSVVRDATLRDLLGKVDRRQSPWLAASFKELGPIARLDSVWLEMMLRPLLTHAESVHGGLSCADGVRAELHFHAATVESAARLETDLKNICGLVRDGGPLLLGRQKELLLLARLLGDGQITRDGRTVSLRCRLTAEELDK